MKNLVLTIALFLAAAFTMTVSAQELSLDKEVHDYGNVAKGGDGSCYFTITNTGTEPLTITRAKGSCGCTVPDWPREAIAPGESAKMKVTYDTKRPGRINKSVTITSNAKATPTKVVRIKGNVTVPAPAN
jgi:hypothetical protein|tara:strand:+ start:170 stop:559 length:390 start_codon:yes stop_codon:yes gene_type:complete